MTHRVEQLIHGQWLQIGEYDDFAEAMHAMRAVKSSPSWMRKTDALQYLYDYLVTGVIKEFPKSEYRVRDARGDDE